MKQTSLTQQHKNAGARMVEYAGYEMPVEFSGVTAEHRAVRNSAGLFDVSHMGEFWVKGKGALELLQFITTNDVSSLQKGQAQYSCLPNGKGGLIDDVIIYRFENDKFLMVVNAANIEKDWLWINHNNTSDTILENASDRMSLIALQGPRAHEIFQPLVKTNLKELGSFCFATETAGKFGEIIISATGYTGAGGLELFCHNEHAPGLWEALTDRGNLFGMIHAGLAARDTLRLEMGYCLYGNDIDETTSPLEAGLQWIVKLKTKGNFIDRDRMEQQMKHGIKRKLVGLEMIDRGIPRKDYTVFNEQQSIIGHITSGTMSPSLQKGIGMGYINIEETNPGNEVFVQIRNKYLNAVIVWFPFIKK